MLDSLRRLWAFAPQPSAAEEEHEVQLAAAVLLIEVGRADFDLDARELAAVAAAMRERLDLTEEELTELVTMASDESEEAHSLHPFLRTINDRFGPQQKERLLEDLWRVAYADERLDKYEEHQIRRIADLLYVPHSTFIRTKYRILESIGTLPGKS